MGERKPSVYTPTRRELLALIPAAAGTAFLAACAPSRSQPAPDRRTVPAQNPAPAPRVEVPSQPQWEPYKSRIGYQIDRPNNWVVGPGVPNEEIFVTPGLGLFLRINVNNADSNVNASNIDNVVQQALIMSRSQRSNADARKVTISNGINAWRISYRSTPASLTQGDSERLSFIANNKVWAVIFEQISSGIDPKMPTIDRVFASFKLT